MELLFQLPLQEVGMVVGMVVVLTMQQRAGQVEVNDILEQALMAQRGTPLLLAHLKGIVVHRVVHLIMVEVVVALEQQAMGQMAAMD
jgi:hypothetical protein